MPERELIVRTSASTSANTASVNTKFLHTIMCPRCGTFDKSGSVSCCAPGGSWFRNCGGRGIKHLDHRWSEGVKACKRKFKADNTYLRD